MPQYYPNQDVICWVKSFITEAYEGAQDEEQKANIRKEYKQFIQLDSGRYEIDIYKWAWSSIAVPFGIEDMFPEIFLNALYNSWEAAGSEASGAVDDCIDTSFSEELNDIFDADEAKKDAEDMFCCDECGAEAKEDDDTTYAMDGTFCNEGCLQNYIDLLRDKKNPNKE